MSVTTSPTRLTTHSVEEIQQAIPGAPVRGLLADLKIDGTLDVAANCGGQVLTMAGALADPAVLQIDWESRSAWVAAGASLAAVSRELLMEGWVLADLAGPSSMTVGGSLALASSAIHSDHSGFPESQPLKIQFVDGLGERRQVVRKGSDATNLLAIVSGLGLTGIATAAQLPIRPVSSGWMLVDSRRCEDFSTLCEALTTSPSANYTYARIDPTGTDAGVGRGTVVTGRHAKVLELPEIRQPDALEYVPCTPGKTAATLSLKVNNVAGGRTLQSITHRTAPPLRRDQLVPLASFFHATAEARIEAKRATGSLTYEFAIPAHKQSLIPQFLERLTRLGGAGDHATLQRCRKALNGPLSLGVSGWLFSIELACDVPGLGRMLDEWDERVVTEGGQVLLATDSRMRPEVLAAMYPGLERWHGLRDELDPGRHFCSDLSRRLGL